MRHATLGTHRVRRYDNINSFLPSNPSLGIVRGTRLSVANRARYTTVETIENPLRLEHDDGTIRFVFIITSE